MRCSRRSGTWTSRWPLNFASRGFSFRWGGSQLIWVLSRWKIWLLEALKLFLTPFCDLWPAEATGQFVVDDRIQSCQKLSGCSGRVISNWAYHRRWTGRLLCSGCSESRLSSEKWRPESACSPWRSWREELSRDCQILIDHRSFVYWCSKNLCHLAVLSPAGTEGGPWSSWRSGCLECTCWGGWGRRASCQSQQCSRFWRAWRDWFSSFSCFSSLSCSFAGRFHFEPLKRHPLSTDHTGTAMSFYSELEAK